MILDREVVFAQLFLLLFVVGGLWDCFVRNDLNLNDINANCSDLLHHLENFSRILGEKELESASARDLCVNWKVRSVAVYQTHDKPMFFGVR